MKVLKTKAETLRLQHTWGWGGYKMYSGSYAGRLDEIQIQKVRLSQGLKLQSASSPLVTRKVLLQWTMTSELLLFI